MPLTTITDSRVEFERLLEPHLRSAGAYAYSITQNRQDAEDAVQDAIVKGLEAWERFDPARPFKSWWLTILRNTCRDLRRRRKSFWQVVQKLISGPESSPVDRVCQADAVQQTLLRLAPEHREILELKYLAECQYTEIAEIIGIPEGTVMSRLHAARKQFAKLHVEITS